MVLLPRKNTAAEGVLQDIHWSQGSFGYFPSYALGSAFGAQLYYHMKEIMDFDGLLKEGKVDVIRDYLREHIHQYGKLKDSRRGASQDIKQATQIARAMVTQYGMSEKVGMIQYGGDENEVFIGRGNG